MRRPRNPRRLEWRPERGALYVYAIRAPVTIDFGPGGGESIVARAGDFFFAPSRTIHRETTSQAADLEAIVLRVGGDPEEVGAEGPEPAGG